METGGKVVVNRKKLAAFVIVLLLAVSMNFEIQVHVSGSGYNQGEVNALSTGTSSADSWPMFRHDPTHSGTSPSTGPTTNRILWSYDAGGMGLSSPAVAGGIVYMGFAFSKRVYALNASTGAYLWSYSTGIWVYSSPAVADGIVYVGSADNNVYALNASTGAYVWSYATGDSVDSSPAVVGGVVYVGSFDGNVYALNASTGAYVWSYATGNQVDSSPAVADGVVYLSSLAGTVYAFGGVHDVAVINVTSAKTVVGRGDCGNLTVSVQNQGNFEDFEVTVFANTTIVETLNFTLTSGSAESQVFTWNTSSLTYGNYTTNAYAWPVEGENDTENNNCTGGWVFVAGVGDLTGGTANPFDFVPDGKVLIEDVAVVAKFFGQNVPPAPANSGVSGTTIGVPDGKIDITDVATVAKCYGQRYSYP